MKWSGYIRKAADQELLYAIFKITDYVGTVHNAEPHRCDDLRFFPLNALPDTITDMTAVCIHNTLEGITYSEFGWDEAERP